MTNGNEERKRRLAQSLRENLRRRKGQARESAAGGSMGGESREVARLQRHRPHGRDLRHLRGLSLTDTEICRGPGTRGPNSLNAPLRPHVSVREVLCQVGPARKNHVQDCQQRDVVEIAEREGVQQQDIGVAIVGASAAQ